MTRIRFDFGLLSLDAALLETSTASAIDRVELRERSTVVLLEFECCSAFWVTPFPGSLKRFHPNQDGLAK